MSSIRAQHAVQGPTPGGSNQRESGRFGGFNLSIMRAPTQLLPVGAAPMLIENSGNAGHEVKGLRMWLDLRAHGCHALDRINTQTDFRRALLTVAEDRVNPDDYNVFATRMPSAVTPEEARGFDDAAHLFPT